MTPYSKLENENLADRFIDQARNFLTTEYLPKIERCLDQLSDEQIWWRPNEQSNSIGNLLLHLSGNARQWIVSGLGGEVDKRNRDSEFAEREGIPGAELLQLLKRTLTDVDDTLAAFDRSRLLELREIQKSEVSALEAVFHVTEHFSMHTGQIILLTKMLAGRDLQFYKFSDGGPVHTWRKAN